jgi:membrane associated rhomboid family serine protease
VAPYGSYAATKSLGQCCLTHGFRGDHRFFRHQGVETVFIGTALSIVAIIAVAFEAHVAGLIIGATAFWVMAHMV